MDVYLLMQTFLPYESFEKSLISLDDKRLSKQRVETFQLLCAIGDEWALDLRIRQGKSPLKQYDWKRHSRWHNHPAANMWRNHVESLGEYYNMSLEVWIHRGKQNNMLFRPQYGTVNHPHWLGDPNFHASHRSNLLQKDFSFYSRHGWTDPDNLDYVWP